MNASLNLNDAAVRRQLEESCGEHARHLFGILDLIEAKPKGWRKLIKAANSNRGLKLPRKFWMLDRRATAALYGMAARTGIFPLPESSPQELSKEDCQLAARKALLGAAGYIGDDGTREISSATRALLMMDALCTFEFKFAEKDVADTAAAWAAMSGEPHEAMQEAA